MLKLLAVTWYWDATQYAQSMQKLKKKKRKFSLDELIQRRKRAVSCTYILNHEALLRIERILNKKQRRNVIENELNHGSAVKDNTKT